ncbi:hypothetical protein FO488_18990 [Geobacter sp. FeAm09]|uniref:HEAT repeat domain-containing protein n=1 Tax=Geobacter sp. FeAm09 TaxID=2597769 RepID=UPI0011ED851E|nr:HEAT repeat domain-containing protein [Geobacter sp. FeAm09]QEM70036.1 hypothetical protein FO488_18990 [Geobacter sp. FeAm09]
MQVTTPSSPPAVLEALGNVSRALRAWQFYPKGHPSRKNSILQAYLSLQRALDGSDLSLVCGRGGFSLPNGEPLQDGMRMTAALSFELFARRAQKITFLRDLFQEDLLGFIRIVSASPDAIQQAGGLARVMGDHGIRTIWANEFDLAAIRGKRREVESRGVVPPGLDEIERGGWEHPAAQELSPTAPEDADPEQALYALLSRLSTTVDEDIYPMLARQGIACCEALMARRELAPVLPLAEILAQHMGDPGRGKKIMGVARFGLEQLAAREEFLEFVLESLGTANGISPRGGLAVMVAGGEAAIQHAVEKMALADTPAVRKKLIQLLGRLGESAVAPILAMLNDKRWYVARNLAAILGDMGSREAVPELEKCLRNPDGRVAKEAIRSLAKIGGPQAETAVIDILRSADSALWPQAIASLGGMKSRKALAVLLQIVCADDRFLQNLALKCDALAAIAMIGDQQATPRLVRLLESRHLFARSRWTQFKIGIAGCLAKLDDSRALPALRKKARGSGELARACTEALGAIERAKE